MIAPWCSATVSSNFSFAIVCTCTCVHKWRRRVLKPLRLLMLVEEAAAGGAGAVAELVLDCGWSRRLQPIACEVIAAADRSEATSASALTRSLALLNKSSSLSSFCNAKVQRRQVARSLAPQTCTSHAPPSPPIPPPIEQAIQ